jgi:subtilisin family serine protease
MERHRSVFKMCAFLIAGTFVAACNGGGGGGGGGGGVLPTPVPPAASACTTTNLNPQSTTHATTASIPEDAPRVMPAQEPSGPQFVPGVVQIVYSTNALSAGSQTLADREAQAGATFKSQIDMSTIGKVLRVVHVAPGNEDTAMSALRAMPDVQSVQQALYNYMHTTSVNFPNDPYLTKEPAGNPPFGPPFYQMPNTGGQWNMHIMCIANAWGYAQSSGNTFGVVAGATGGGTKIAIIDTGVDLTHTDIAGKVIRFNACDTGVGTCSTAAGDQHDNMGHGTDTAGIAAANANNNYGFAGVGWNTQLIIEKVFADGNPGASSADISAAINDAVANGAKVISMSLGSAAPCPSSENTAVQAALAAGTVVVASSGNNGANFIDSPACDLGVIAVGATGLNDSGSPIVETVASYSQYNPGDPMWGVVAPGGNPTSNADSDFYHWINDLWSHTAPPPTCSTDPFGGVSDCRIFIAGTSMAAPHVAGVVALLIGAKPSLTPAQAKALLCSTTVNIGDYRQGCGRVEAYRAMAHLLGDNTVP